MAQAFAANATPAKFALENADRPGSSLLAAERAVTTATRALFSPNPM